MNQRIHAFFSTIGPVGHLGRGCGTAGAAVALPFAYGLLLLPFLVQIAICLTLTLLSTYSVNQYVRATLQKDPQEVVLDEFVGCLIAALFVPLNGYWILAAFVMFRVFDIAKPWPVCAAERLRGGIGVMADDVVAGLLAGIVLLAARLAI